MNILTHTTLILLLVVWPLFMISCDGGDEPVETEDAFPEIIVRNPVGTAALSFEEDGNKFFSITFKDDKGLERFSIVNNELDIAIDSALNGTREYVFERNIFLSADTPREYAVQVNAVDIAGQVLTQEIVLTRVDDQPDIVTLNTGITYQTIRNFGASDAWSTQFVGKNWTGNRSEMAQLLFSKEVDESGNPEGIGLTAWRFNIGGGSTEQGEESNITDEWRRAETFLNADGTYDWNKQEGQRWFLQQAESYGVEDLIAFVNSPPVHYTKNGKAYSSDGNSSNLKSDAYEGYAIFLSEVLKNIGVDIDYISPVNETQNEWVKCCGQVDAQEGSPWSNAELYDLIVTMNDVFTERGINTQISITESARIDYLYAPNTSTGSDDQLEFFFSPSSEGYVGDLPFMSDHVSGHSYFTTDDLARLKNSRVDLTTKMNTAASTYEYWMTEYSILGGLSDNNGELRGSGRDLGMDAALYVSRMIHSDLTFANASAWHWWLAISPYDYKDGLIYIDKNKNNGNYQASKLLWALGNFSRFVKPGMQRVDVVREGSSNDVADLSGLMQSAYASDEEIVVVLINYNNASEKIKFRLIGEQYTDVDMYQTSASQNLSYITTYTIEDEILIAGRSIVTCVIR